MSDHVVVITGASSGIGAALAEKLAGDGSAVVLVARRADALNAVAARCGAAATTAVADVTSRGDVQRVVDETVARTGRIDVWVNNAGRGITRLPSELTDADIDDMMLANVKSALYGIQAVLPHFKAAGPRPRHERVVDARPDAAGDVPLRLLRRQAFPQRPHRQPARRAGADPSRHPVLAGLAGRRAAPSSASTRCTAGPIRARCPTRRAPRRWPR